MGSVNINSLREYLEDNLDKADIQDQSQREVVRLMINHIYALMEIGYRRDQIRKMLESKGLVIPYSTLSRHIKELKNEVNREEVNVLLARFKVKVKDNVSELTGVQVKEVKEVLKPETKIQAEKIIGNDAVQLTPKKLPYQR